MLFLGFLSFYVAQRAGGLATNASDVRCREWRVHDWGRSALTKAGGRGESISGLRGINSVIVLQPTFLASHHPPPFLFLH